MAAEELLLTDELVLVVDELTADDETLLLLLIDVDEITELDVEEATLLVLSSTLVALDVLLAMLEVCEWLTQPLNIKAKTAIIIGNLLFLFIVCLLYTKNIHKKRPSNKRSIFHRVSLICQKQQSF